MASSSRSVNTTPPHPSPPRSVDATSPTSSVSSSASESEGEGPRTSRLERPKLASRVPSASIIIPKGKEIETASAQYPADDARAMSPRRDSADLERLGQEARQSLKEYDGTPATSCRALVVLMRPSQAKSLQSSLQTLAERIDEVKSDHDKLENENKFLQDYIGGLTRTMSKGDIQSTSGVKSKK